MNTDLLIESTFDLSKIELNKQYYVSSEHVVNINMLSQLAEEQAQKLNAKVFISVDVIRGGWHLLLIPKNGQ